MVLKRDFIYSGIIPDNDILHFIKEHTDGTVNAPNYVYVPGVGNIAQYSDTVFGMFKGYDPENDCNGSFMPSKFQMNNNSYAYACQIASNTYPQPGRVDGHILPQDFVGADVVKAAQKDGLIDIGESIEHVKDFNRNNGGLGHYVCLLVSESNNQYGLKANYHWVRCDDNRDFSLWSYKMGAGMISNLDFAGKPISDPAIANWSINQGLVLADEVFSLSVVYKLVTYMFVPGGRVDII